MPRQNRLGLWLALFWVTLAPAVRASSASLVSFDDSINAVASAPTTGKLDPRTPWIARSVLMADEETATMDFEVVLKMRNFSELQARMDQGARVPLAEMAAKYQPLASDYQSVVNWLTGQGFIITRLDSNHLAVFLRGTVRQIEQAFRMRLARVQYEGQEYTAAVSAPNVPATLAPVLLGINGLQPYMHPHKHLIVKPNSATGNSLPYQPNQIVQAYDATGLANFFNGAGQAIAIIIDTAPNTSDLTSFWTTCNINQSLSNMDFIQVISNVTYPAPSGEETLDVEWSSSIAPGSQVRVYETSSLSSTYLDEAYSAVYSDITKNGINIQEMSMSYGGGESNSTQSQVNTDEAYFMELANAGVTIFASSGDGGSTPDTGSGSTGASDEKGPLQVEEPADDPYVTGVGGTSLVLNSSGNESSETVWNNSYGASGGGASGYTTSHGRVIVTFSRPSFQTGTGVPSGTTRLVPDIAGPADPNYGGLVILGGQQEQYGGTSWASPTMAGFCALLNQALANSGMPSLGLWGSQIYPLITTANFRDITSGNNYTSKSPTKYAAGVGYDETTGIGVPLVQTLAQTLTGSSTPSMTTQPVAQVVTAGQSVSFTAAASGTTPLDYQWQINGVNIPGATNATYAIASTAGTNTGAYSVIVTNPYGSITSNAANFIAVTSQPVAQTVTAGSSATFSISVPTTGAPYSFQWLFNGTAIAGATGSSYMIDDVSDANAGAYSVMVTDAYGSVTTNAVSLTVNDVDTPTMPAWSLILLGAFLLGASYHRIKLARSAGCIS